MDSSNFAAEQTAHSPYITLQNAIFYLLYGTYCPLLTAEKARSDFLAWAGESEANQAKLTNELATDNDIAMKKIAQAHCTGKLHLVGVKDAWDRAPYEKLGEPTAIPKVYPVSMSWTKSGS